MKSPTVQEVRDYNAKHNCGIMYARRKLIALNRKQEIKQRISETVHGNVPRLQDFVIEVFELIGELNNEIHDL